MTYTADIYYYITTVFDYAKTRLFPCTQRCSYNGFNFNMLYSSCGWSILTTDSLFTFIKQLKYHPTWSIFKAILNITTCTLFPKVLRGPENTALFEVFVVVRTLRAESPRKIRKRNMEDESARRVGRARNKRKSTKLNACQSAVLHYFHILETFNNWLVFLKA